MSSSIAPENMSVISAAKFQLPIVAVLGGSPTGSRIGCIGRLMELADTLIIGGGLANVFLKARGGRIGMSVWNDDEYQTAVSLLQQADQRSIKVLLPIDTFAANEMRDGIKPSLEGSMALFDDKIGMDIGPRSAVLFSNTILRAGTVIWSGRMGMTEFANFAGGTRAVAKAIAETHARRIICGRDSVAAAQENGIPAGGYEAYDSLDSFLNSTTD